MFQFRRFPSYTYFVQCMIHVYCTCVFPHSDISGSTLICSSPKLFAACHVLHRLLMPRHSPCALFSLTFLKQSPVWYLVLLNYAGSTRSFSKLSLPFIFLKFSTICFLESQSLLIGYSLCCLAFFFPLFSFQGASESIVCTLKIEQWWTEKVWPWIPRRLFIFVRSP